MTASRPFAERVALQLSDALDTLVRYSACSWALLLFIPVVAKLCELVPSHEIAADTISLQVGDRPEYTPVRMGTTVFASATQGEPEAHCRPPTRAERDLVASSSVIPAESVESKPVRLATMMRGVSRVVLVLSRTDCAPCRAQVSWVGSLAGKAARTHTADGASTAIFEVLLEESASTRPHDLDAFRGGAPLLLWPAGARQFTSVPKSLLVENGKLVSVCDGMLLRPSTEGEQIQAFLKP